MLAILALVLALAAAVSGPPGAPRAAGQSRASEVTPQTDAAVPAHDVVMLGSSAGEAPAETWGIGKIGSDAQFTWTIVHYDANDGWSLTAAILDGSGQPLGGFAPDENVLAGAMTADGGGALLGSVPATPERREILLVRNPGQPFQETPAAPPLEKSELLFSPRRSPMVAALEEGGGVAGALVVPVVTESSSAETRVLHWNGKTWASEPIEVPKASKEAGGFRVLAIAAGSPSNAWLLAQLSSSSASVALFRRDDSGGSVTWQPVSPAPGEPAGAALEVNGKAFEVEGTGEPPTNKQQLLTVTDQGLWIDGVRPDISAHVTMFFEPAGEGADSGEVLASWCAVPGACTHALPESLPAGPSRSFAWSNPSAPFGERVITGLPEGVTLRLEGEEFKRVLALGGSEPANDVGGTLGAAFSTATEGWLGNEELPVHLTLNPEPNRLAPYPVPFRLPLLAVAPQPGAPVGALSSQALAVGEEGEVARYMPGAGWEPESLLNIGGRRETPQLRAVAWPSPSRAYAVGDGEGGRGEMWLWRGETGLWERDPATPLNLRADLLGIAFDPEDASRGYVVGQSGVLLRFGKTWTQERTCEPGVPEPCLPAEVAQASFTSVAFAGSEAIVAYRVPHLILSGEGSVLHYTGGVLLNSGSGWRVDSAAAAALASENEDIPWAVAALPDGGAALSADSSAGVPRVLERNSAEAPWEATAQRYPGFQAPGSLALFREGGALRVIGSGGVPNTQGSDDVAPPPAGSPPALILPYPLAGGGGYVLRQTATGWSDQEHDHSDIQAPPGRYRVYDMVNQPDPIWAVLIDPAGASGWAVGGVVGGSSGRRADTADIARYPADGSTPPGVGASPVPVSPGEAAFAIGGGAQCAAPCADRADAGIGPDVWLSSALDRAGSIPGVRDFLYTGPRVTTGATSGTATVEIDYERELARYAALLLGSEHPAHVAASPTDRPNGSECVFEEQLSQLLDNAGAASGCASGQSAYYAFTSSGAGGPVQVIVLDESTPVEATQLAWLKAELANATNNEEPAIVVGSANLNAQSESGEEGARAVVGVLEEGHASAYFFDAPEQNLALQLPGSHIPAYGSGTLGYVNAVAAEKKDFLGASGFLLAQVGAYNPKEGRAPVTAALIPDIGELAMEAKEGTLLRRSQVALFDALARRPRAGGEATELGVQNESYIYTPIPDNCVGEACVRGIRPEYTFSSSREGEIGEFVTPNEASAEPNAVLLGSNGKPIHDAKSGLFCAYNAGTTDVTISAGGLSASLPVTVQAGSVRRPCGTAPLNGLPTHEQQVGAPVQAPPPSPTPATSPASAPPVLPAPPPPPPPLAVAPPVPGPARVVPPPFFVQPLVPVLVPAIVPPPLPAPANPTPPSGTSAVTSPVEAAQKEEEQEEATESVSNQALAYRAPEHEPSPGYVVGIVLLAAFAGAAGARRRPRRGRRELRVAPATISTIRAQRRVGDGRRWRP